MLNRVEKKKGKKEARLLDDHDSDRGGNIYEAFYKFVAIKLLIKFNSTLRLRGLMLKTEKVII